MSTTPSPEVRVRVRVLKIRTRVRLEYTARLEYYITGIMAQKLQNLCTHVLDGRLEGDEQREDQEMVVG